MCALRRRSERGKRRNRPVPAFHQEFVPSPPCLLYKLRRGGPGNPAQSLLSALSDDLRVVLEGFDQSGNGGGIPDLPQRFGGTPLDLPVAVFELSYQSLNLRIVHSSATFFCRAAGCLSARTGFNGFQQRYIRQSYYSLLSASGWRAIRIACPRAASAAWAQTARRALQPLAMPPDLHLAQRQVVPIAVLPA
jgi:hypothetical protein